MIQETTLIDVETFGGSTVFINAALVESMELMPEPDWRWAVMMSSGKTWMLCTSEGERLKRFLNGWGLR